MNGSPSLGYAVRATDTAHKEGDMENGEIQLLKAEVEKLKEELRENMGRLMAHETTFAAILSMWGKPARDVEAELRRVLQVVSDDVTRQGAHRATMIGFNASADPFLKLIGRPASGER
jgi:hypothetical protein